jgi:hypothetical protein
MPCRAASVAVVANLRPPIRPSFLVLAPVLTLGRKLSHAEAQPRRLSGEDRE